MILNVLLTFFKHYFISTEKELESVLGDVDSKSFTSLTGLVSNKTLKAIQEMGFKDMMEIQYKSIRPLLEGRYIVILLVVDTSYVRP